MADERGYGTPIVEGFTATASPAPAADSLTADASAPRKVTITLHGEGFIQRAMPLIVKIGDIVVLGKYQITVDRRHLTFELDELPEDGAPILIGYGGDDLVELPIRFSRDAIQEGPSEPQG